MARIARRIAGIGASDLPDAAAFDAYVGPAREITVDQQRGIIALHDGVTPGGQQFHAGGGGDGDTAIDPIPKSFAGKVGANQTYTLDLVPATAANVLVYVGGIRQTPTTDYTISGATLTILDNPDGLEVDTLLLAGPYSLTFIQNGSVTEAKLAPEVAEKLNAADEIAEQLDTLIGGQLRAPTLALAMVLTPEVAPGSIETAGHTTAGDGGGALYKSVATEPSHAGKFSITLSDGVTVVWYEISDRVPTFAAFGAKSDGTTGDHDALENQLQFAKFGVLPRGNTAVSETLVIDNSTMGGETETGPQGTIITGQDARHSILVAKAGLTGSVLNLLYGTGASAHAHHRLEKLSVLGVSAADGIKVKNAAFLRVSDVTARGCNIGIELESVLSSSFRDGRVDANDVGISAVKGTGFSYPNALKFDSWVFSNNSQLGYSGGGAHHNVQFIGGSFEANGTQGNVNTGGVFLNFDGGVEGAVGAVFQGVYFEGNGGAADIRLENTGSSYVTVIIEGCNFNRVSAAKFVTANIVAIGKINLVLIGNAFRAMNDYVESASRPYVSRSADVRVSEVGNYFASPLAAAGFLSRGNTEQARGAIAATGAAHSLPDGWTSTKTGTGLYQIIHGLGAGSPLSLIHI